MKRARPPGGAVVPGEVLCLEREGGYAYGMAPLGCSFALFLLVSRVLGPCEPRLKERGSFFLVGDMVY